MTTAVVHLVWAPLERFLCLYQAHPAGAPGRADEQERKCLARHCTEGQQP
jgi:hypothetical protein